MKTKSFTYLWIGQSMANAGDIFYIVSLIASIYQMTESTFVTAFIPFTVTISQFISGFVAPLVIDRASLKNILVYSQLGKTILLVALMAYTTLESGGQSILIVVFLIVAFIAFLDGWANPAKGALVPRLVSQEEWMKANGFMSVIDQIVQLGGWPAGSLLVAWVGPPPLLSITCAMYALATAAMALIQEGANMDQPKGKKGAADSLKEGWSIIWKHRPIRYLTIISCMESMANVVWIAAILYVYVDEQLGVSEAWWGFINTSFFAGLLIGGFIAMKSSGFIEKNMSVIFISFGIGISIVTLLFGFTTIPYAALGFSFAFGICNEIQQIIVTTTLQKKTDSGQLPKIYAAQGALFGLMFGISSLLAGFLADIVSVRFLFAGASAILLIVAMVAWNQKKSLFNRKELG
ncbi:MFS transporter [Bacillus sp. 1P06AnD]|uniref:MFS transporter n=1 Tax=Bacillus sp. 1P06AnD TaxID=3132208 RepID=UPI0039A1B84D